MRSAWYCFLTGIGVCVFLLATSTWEAPRQDLQTFDVPPQAAAVHYVVRTFSTGFGAEEVDIVNTSKPGFKWYPYRFFGAHPELANLILNPDGSVTLLGDTTGPNADLAT